MRKPLIHLLCIDMQNDFCDPNGTLYVKGAEQDVDRAALFIDKSRMAISKITATLDSHYQLHIGNPLWFLDGATRSNHPNPFTLIRADDVKGGVWTTARPEVLKWTISYLEALEKAGKIHTIWPPHCLIGTEGHAVSKKLQTAIHEWERARTNIARCVSKGSNPKVEHFSGFRSEVPDPEDPSTLMNTDLVRDIEEADQIILFGEASTHCVLETVSDLVSNFSDKDAIKKTTLLIDCTSPVPDPVPGLFSTRMDAFLRDMKARGMRICKSTEVTL